MLGTSGGGKTTFIKLINRLHDPDTGTVLVNNRMCRRSTLSSCARASAMSSSRRDCSRT
ncbi:MAG: ATP-binding cassette domain-containing protein [Collinsella sp.]